jgi:hypothetical protein
VVTEIYVDPAGMWGLYNLLVRVHQDATATVLHVRKWCDIGFPEEGILLNLMGSHGAVFGDITTKLDEAQQLALQLHSRVQRAANALKNADMEALRIADAAIHPDLVLSKSMDEVLADSRPALQAEHSRFGDAAEPQVALRSPEGAAGDTDFKVDFLTGLLSPTAWVRYGSQEIFNFDPFTALLKPITGNWVAYAESGVVWSQASVACTAMATNLYRAAQDLPQVFRGNAADELQAFLVLFATAMDSLAEECNFYVGTYEQASRSALDFFDSIGKPIADFVDAIVYAAIAGYLGAATVETVVGAVIGWSVAAWYVAQAIKIYYLVQGAYDSFQAIIKVAAATQEAWLASNRWEMPRLGDVPVVVPQ